MNLLRPFKNLPGALLVILFFSCNRPVLLFQKISSYQSGIHFNNMITETDSVNPINLQFLYNGNGVSVGDFNNDGLQDLYFTGSQASNKMYINKGEFKFIDVTKEADVAGKGRWCNAASVVDINNDGLQDIYVCTTIKSDAAERQNLLYINQGNNKDNVPIFKEQALEYQLNDTGFSVHAAFFDYDNDGDLDMYLLCTQLADRYPGNFRPIIKDGSSINNDKLFRNDWDTAKKHPVFTDVSSQSGIVWEGYGLGVNIVDINMDGWKDIYVTNDFVGDDVLYINNQNGTFSNKAHSYFKHSSYNAMGNDVADINNDGLFDFISVDMNPEGNYRKKMMMDANKYHQVSNLLSYGYMIQYVKNTLQVNQGQRLNGGDTIGDPVFSEVAFLAGVAQTDWSWAPLMADFDNDGLKDIIITNGYPKDVTEHDFAAYRSQTAKYASGLTLSEQIPTVKISNYAYKNNGNLSFSNATKDWGIEIPSFSNGAVYVDLDNDGDLDYVVNNINDEAFVYRNTTSENSKDSLHYLKIAFKGDSLNLHGIGAIAHIYYDGSKQQLYENSPCRGYLSSVQDIAHFGLGKTSQIDSLVVIWPGGKKESIINVRSNQLLRVDIKNAVVKIKESSQLLATNNIFTNVTAAMNVTFVHQQNDFVDFNIQKLLPHKFSDYGPGLTIGDLNGDGLDDIFSGGASRHSPQIFFQQKNNKFVQKAFLSKRDAEQKKYSDMGILLFDAENDGDLDLYSSSGGFEENSNSIIYKDHFYINDGKGNFINDSTAFPVNLTSKSCVRAVDYDRDGDMDIFIAGRVDPWNYPKPVSSIIYRNDSKNGNIKFKDVTGSVAKDLLNIGLICDAVFTDFNNDGWKDVILAGEWMPVTFLKNDKGIFKNVTAESGLSEKTGWWTSIAPGDFDNDGDIDFIVGNTGLNSFYQATEKYPVFITAKDYDNNGSYDAFPSLYLFDSLGEKKEFPSQTRDDAVKQMVSLRSKFQNYKSFASASMEQVITPEQRKGALRLSANTMKSYYISNDGNGRFSMKPLPVEAQMSVLNGMVVDDFNDDGNLDVVISGNDFGGEVTNGRFDALNGLLLSGNGKGDFKALTIMESGIFIPGDGKSLVKLLSFDGNYLLGASQNKGPIEIFRLKENSLNIPVLPFDDYALIKYRNGAIQRQEFYYGSSFLSQSARFIHLNKSVTAVTITNQKGEKRSVDLTKKN